MPLHLCSACSQANKHQSERRPQVSRADSGPARALIPRDRTVLRRAHVHCSCCHGGGGDGTEGWPIKYLSVCFVASTFSGKGKCIMFGSVRVQHQIRGNRTLFYSGNRFVLFFFRGRHDECLHYDMFGTLNSDHVEVL